MLTIEIHKKQYWFKTDVRRWDGVDSVMVTVLNGMIPNETTNPHKKISEAEIEDLYLREVKKAYPELKVIRR